jgi:hypothetical protein
VLEGKNQRRVDPAHRKAPPPAALVNSGVRCNTVDG